MTSTTLASGGAYGRGLQARTLEGERCWGHDGFWGAELFHCPQSGTTYAVTISSALVDLPAGTLAERLARALRQPAPPA